jgi:hypothetical protein
MSTSTQRHPIRLGLPKYLAQEAARADWGRDVALATQRVQLDMLLDDYSTAGGHEFDWGHVIEEMELRHPSRRTISFNFVPVRLWQECESARRTVPLGIADWCALLRREVSQTLGTLPSGLVVHLSSDRNARSHTLLSIVLMDQERELDLRRWILEEVAEQRWPRLAAFVARRVRVLAPAYSILNAPAGLHAVAQQGVRQSARRLELI